MFNFWKKEPSFAPTSAEATAGKKATEGKGERPKSPENKEKIGAHSPGFSKENFIRAHIFVFGKVQGVFFRENTRKKAEKSKVSGWVKNLSDGRVEAVFEGEREEVEKMVNWARKGPIWAKIEALDVVWEDCKGEFKGFDIRYDL